MEPRRRTTTPGTAPTVAAPPIAGSAAPPTTGRASDAVADDEGRSTDGELRRSATRLVGSDPAAARALANDLCRRGTAACIAAAGALRRALAMRAAPFVHAVEASTPDLRPDVEQAALAVLREHGPAQHER